MPIPAMDCPLYHLLFQGDAQSSIVTSQSRRIYSSGPTVSKSGQIHATADSQYSPSAAGTNSCSRILRQRGAGKDRNYNDPAEEGNGPPSRVKLLQDMSRNIFQQDGALAQRSRKDQDWCCASFQASGRRGHGQATVWACLRSKISYR